MFHPADGTLRRLLDEPLSIALRDREHCARCARCQARMAEFIADAGRAADALSVPPLAVDAAAACARAARRAVPDLARGASPVMTPVAAGPLAGRLPAAWGRPLRVATALIAAAALVGALTATGAAHAFLTIFQPRQVTVVTVTPSDFSALPDLSAYGSVVWTVPPSEHAAASLAAAERETGQHVLAPASVPAGVETTPSVHVFPVTSGTFTFDPARAAAAAAAAGATLPPMPPDIAGSTLYGSVGPAVVQVFHSTAAVGGTGSEPAAAGLASLPALVVGQTVAPTISTNGVTLQTLRDYLLQQPGIPPDLAAQLRALSDPAQTLPIPVPAGATATQTVTVRGVPGVWIGDQSGLGGGVVWQDGGIIYGVGGMFSEQEILAIANGLR